MDEDLAVGMVGVGEAADTVEEVWVGRSSLAEEMFELIFGKGLKKLMKRLILLLLLLLLINLALAIAAAFGRSFGCFGRGAAAQIGEGRKGGSSIRSKILILRLLFVVVFGWVWRRRLGFGGLGFQLSLLGHGDGRRNWGNTKRGRVGDGFLYN